jgi:hypothetical protein
MKTKKEKFNVEQYPKTFTYVLENDTHNIRCNGCGSVVLKETNGSDYPYQCLFCDENLYSFETHKGEFHTDAELNDICLNALILELDT